jgi:hypothetical protein
MIEKLSHGDQRDILNLGSESSVVESHERSLVVLLVEIRVLQDLMFLLHFLESRPFLLISVQVELGCALDRLVLEAVQLLLAPETSDIAFLGQTINHLVPRVSLVLLTSHEQ